MHIVFETPRLMLRQITIEDAPLIYKLNSDPEIVKYVHEHILKNEEEAKEIINNFIIPQYKNQLGRWAVHTKTDYEFIGWCGLKYIPEEDITDLGYRFLKSAWGKGYATEAAQYTLIYGLKNLKIKTITGRSHIDNVASIKVLEKTGMKFSKNEIVDGCPIKTYTLSLPDLNNIC